MSEFESFDDVLRESRALVVRHQRIVAELERLWRSSASPFPAMHTVDVEARLEELQRALRQIEERMRELESEAERFRGGGES